EHRTYSSQPVPVHLPIGGPPASPAPPGAAERRVAPSSTPVAARSRRPLGRARPARTRRGGRLLAVRPRVRLGPGRRRPGGCPAGSRRGSPARVPGAPPPWPGGGGVLRRGRGVPGRHRRRRRARAALARRRPTAARAPRLSARARRSGGRGLALRPVALGPQNDGARRRRGRPGGCRRRLAPRRLVLAAGRPTLRGV
ncbi:MAG: hypothetical protein AVDCRST_MAG49-2105, partial [uncultured Thermomicrobiales bacterium]